MFKEFNTDCPLSSVTSVKIFLCEYIWMNLTFSVTRSHNSACICSHI